MWNYNKVVLMGNLAQDPEFKELEGNKQVTNFVIAVNRVWKGPEGEEHTEVSFIDCEIWGKSAKAVADHFYKGRPIFIEGRLKQEKWTDKETQKQRSKTRVVAENFVFVNAKKTSDSGEAIPAAAGNAGNTSNDSESTDSNEEFDAL